MHLGKTCRAATRNNSKVMMNGYVVKGNGYVVEGNWKQGIGRRGDSPIEQKVDTRSNRVRMASSSSSSSRSSLDNILGLLRVRVLRGINLAVRDFRSSDPYVLLKMGKQKLKTRVVKKNVNPEWNEDLTFSVVDPTLPIRLEVFDHDTFTLDDRMGEAEFDIQPFVEAVKMHKEGIPNGTVLRLVQPNRQNDLAEESRIVWLDGKVVQEICIRLRNVECGEVELQLQWISLPGARS